MAKKAQSRLSPKKPASSSSGVVWAAALVALVAVGAVIVIALSQQARQSAPVAPTLASSESRYAGIPRGVDAAGFPRLGDPNAPVLVQEISDFT